MKYPSVIRLALASILALLTFATVAPRRAQKQPGPRRVPQQATSVQPGAMTEKQKTHSRLYNGLGLGRKLSELPTTKRDKIGDADINIVRSTGLPFSSGQEESIPLLDKAALNADAVVIGTFLMTHRRRLRTAGTRKQ